MPNVAVLVGSLRKDSHNRKLARALEKLAGDRLAFRFIEIGDLPLYNEDLWPNPPASVPRFKAEVRACDAVLMVTPEYNRGPPAVLKNAFDWGTRPWGDNIWDGKAGALAGTSTGAISTAVAQSQLRNSLLALGVVLMGAPELHLLFKPGLIDEAGEISDEGTKAFLAGWVDKYVAWIAMVLHAKA
jgi:chromate reductase, NAD(P)H dehydrogenase (quinone)